MKPHSILAAAAILIAAGLPAPAVDTPSPASVPDLAGPRARIAAKDWLGAIAELEKIAETVMHADVYSLLGYSLRQSGNTALARTYYAKALDFDPDHKGAREYLGELYVQMGNMAKAREQLAVLEKLCPAGCEELDDLRKNIGGAGSPSR